MRRCGLLLAVCGLAAAERELLGLPVPSQDVPLNSSAGRQLLASVAGPTGNGTVVYSQLMQHFVTQASGGLAAWSSADVAPRTTKPSAPSPQRP